MIHQKRMNSQGIAHIIAPIVVAVLIGIAGVYTVVNSSASTPKKAVSSAVGGSSSKIKSILTIHDFYIDSKEVSLLSELLDKNKQPIGQGLCAGSVKVSIVGKNSLSDTTVSPVFENGGCMFKTRFNTVTKDGRYLIRVSYSGSPLFKSYKHGTFKRVVNAAIPPTTGPVTVAPAR